MDLEVLLEEVETSELTWVDAADANLYDNHKIVDSTGFDDLPFKVDEETSLEELHDFAEAINDLDDDLVLAVCEEFPYSDPSLSQLTECFREERYTAYSGNLSDVAREFVEEGLYGDVSDALKGYIDYEKMGEDIRHDGYTETSHGYVIRFDD